MMLKALQVTCLISFISSILSIGDVKVIETAKTQFIFNDEPYVLITGANFNPSGNTLKFKNDLIGGNVNYTVLANFDTELKLRLKPGSLWHEPKGTKFPQQLNLIGVNAGDGFYIMGTDGVRVATIYERPTIRESKPVISRTDYVATFELYGTGFPTSSSVNDGSDGVSKRYENKVTLKFHPRMTDGKDFKVEVKDEKTLLVSRFVSLLFVFSLWFGC